MLGKDSINFAKACIDSGIVKLDTSARLEKAKLIAKQKGIFDYENADKLQKIIDDYLAEEEEKKQAQKKKAIKKLKWNEIENKKELEKYAELKGREKCIEYYNDIIKSYDRIIQRREDALEASKQAKIAYSALNASIEPVKSPPEQDWAIAGGIASALAGPAAGISVAADIQRKNAESRIDPHEAAKSVEIQRIKNTNTANSLAQHFLDTCSVSDEEYRSARHTKDDYIKLQEQSELLLVDNTVDPHRLMSNLSPSIVFSEITASGSVHISLKVTGGIYRIYEDVPAVIDGSFKVLLWDKEGAFHGMASAVLPIHGVSKDTVLEAWFTEPQEPQASIEEYDIRFAKPNLWLLETNSDSKINKALIEEPNIDRKAETYYEAYILSQSTTKNDIIKAEQLFLSLGEWKDAQSQMKRCTVLIKNKEEKEESVKEQEKLKAEQLEQEKILKAEHEKQIQLKKAKRTKIIKLVSIFAIFCSVVIVITNTIIIPEKQKSKQYDNAVKLFKEGSYADATEAFKLLGDYKDSEDKAKECQYNDAIEKMDSQDYSEAEKLFRKLADYKDSAEKARLANRERKYSEALDYMENKEYEQAYKSFLSVRSFKDADAMLSNFYIVPQKVYCNTKNHYFSYQFEYTNQGLMRRCTLKAKEFTYSFDKEGVLTRIVDKYGNNYTYEYTSDGITRTSRFSFGKINNQSLYDQYGNMSIISTLSGAGDLSKKLDFHLDENHNVTSNNITNEYGLNGLKTVKLYIDNDSMVSHFEYMYIYSEAVPENYIENIWRNIRLICGAQVWGWFY